MSQAEKLVSLNSQAAEVVAGQNGAMDDFAAELVLRNLAVATDRLTAREFSKLSPDTVDKVLDTTSVARELAPLEETELQRMPRETEAEYQYRTTILQPLHSLQRKVANGDFDKSNDLEARKIRAGVKLSGKAFGSIMTEASQNPAIRKTERYFWGNTSAAAKRLNIEH